MKKRRVSSSMTAEDYGRGARGISHDRNAGESTGGTKNSIARHENTHTKGEENIRTSDWENGSSNVEEGSYSARGTQPQKD